MQGVVDFKFGVFTGIDIVRAQTFLKLKRFYFKIFLSQLCFYTKINKIAIGCWHTEAFYYINIRQFDLFK